MKTIPENFKHQKNPAFETEYYFLCDPSSTKRSLPDARAAEGRQARVNDPRTVIRGESPTGEKNKSQAALTDWLNVSFSFHSENSNPLEFFKSFSEATKGIFGGMTDQQRGLHGWTHSFKFDRGCTLFAYGGQNKTAFLSLPAEGCALISDWKSFTSYLRDQLQARITRWDGAVDDFNGIHSVDIAIEFYKQG